MWSVQNATARLGRPLSRQYAFFVKRPKFRKDALTDAEDHIRDELASMVKHRPTAKCKLLQYTPHIKTCFDLDNAVVEYGRTRDSRFIRSFLYTHYWPREPSINNVWMRLDSPYLNLLTNKLALSGDRYVAYQLEPRTQECKMVGVLIANKICPWTVDEFEEWALQMEGCEPEQTRIAFQAHILRETDLFKKYHVPYVYDLEVVATAAEVTSLGLAELLLRVAISRAMEAQHPVVQIQAKSAYVAKLCDRLGMTREWSMKYEDFKDYTGRPRFYRRSPHSTLTLYTRVFDHLKGGVPDMCDHPKLYNTYTEMLFRPRVQREARRTCFTRDNMHYSNEVKRVTDNYRSGTCTCYKNIFQKTFLSECPAECYRNPMEKLRHGPKTCP